MWRNNAQQTGANDAPLASQRRWGGGGDDRGPPPPVPPMNGYGGRDDRGPPGGGYGGPPGGGYGGRDERGYGGGGYGGDDRGRPSSRFDDRGPPGFGPPGGGYGGGPSGLPPPPPSAGLPPPPPPPADSSSSAAASPAPGERKRKSRWGDKTETAAPVAITGGVQEQDLEKYAVQLRLDEIQRSLRTGQVVPPEHARSPSPPPTYDSHGRRTNTREVRYRKKLEDERMRLVDRQMKLDPAFRPPPEYLMAKRQSSGRPTDKVYIPVKEFPEINFFGLLVGPRGNSLKKMERESGARISIRGKGSVKEGKGRPGHRDEDENDELHCLITGESEEKVQACVKLINTVIETAASVPEGQNDHKRNQLRELAALNGTLRDDENQICQNCGGVGHRKYDCPEQKNWSANIICRICGGAGHMARDCTQRRGGFGGPPGFGAPPGPPGMGGPPSVAQQFDSEYASLMAELGETPAAPPMAPQTPAAPGGPPPGAPSGPAGGMMGSPMGQQQQPVDENGNKIPPWRIPENWNPMPANFNRAPPQQRPPPPPQQGYGQPQGNGYGGGYPQQQQGGYGDGGGYPQQQQQPQQGYGGGYGGGY
ncbi:hypothetical protein JCM8097_004870 [Rhodosporidiobolus ruineniae]